MIKISELPIPPEEYQKEIVESLNPRISEHPMMSPDERYFLNGLLAYYKPTNVLELGVNFGEGSAQILHNIRNTPEAKLTSIDLAEFAFYNEIIDEKKNTKRGVISDEPIGKFAFTHPDLPLDKWTLVTGKDPSEVIAGLDNSKDGYDFLVLDTAHLHPIELLNFLCVLPYLRDGAIVVLHDITLFALYIPPYAFACRQLFGAVVAERIQLNSRFSNIGAFQVSADTRKYIQNVFESLVLPWEIDPRNVRTSAIATLLNEHYALKELSVFREALRLNMHYYVSGKIEWHCWENMRTELFVSHLFGQTIYYGAGRNMADCLEYCKQNDIVFEAPIWDIAADKIGEICGHRVTVPDYSSSGIKKTLIITIWDEQIRETVRVQFEKLGYTVKCYIWN
ncbi:hypothetical protein FACS1894111_03580 [Clostridia bacterium]|nr:hypothetical protein FACS1894111_03580 [Clostridia bacterium]